MALKSLYNTMHSMLTRFCLLIRPIVKKLQFKTGCKDHNGFISQLKQQKIKKVILLSSTSPYSQCADNKKVISPFEYGRPM